MKNFPIIAFTGKMGSGKTTAADYLRETHGFARLSFAAPLKRAAFAIFGEEFDRLMLVGKEEPSEFLFGNSPRHVLQTLGTEWGRNFIHQDLWVELFSREVDRIEAEGVFSGIVVDDLRFVNEADKVLNMGGVVFRVVKSPHYIKPSIQFWDSIQFWNRKTKQSLHSSEAGIPNQLVSATIKNDFTENFTNSVDSLVQRYISSLERF